MKIQTLFEKYQSILTFAEVADWNEQATREIEKINSAISSIEIVIKLKTQALEQAHLERQQKSALSRLFGSGEEKKIQADIDALILQKNDHQAIIEELNNKLDNIPNNPEEQATMLKELQLEKKELLLRKRETKAQTKSIRIAARQKSANLPNTFSGAFGGSKYIASSRRNIRSQKEASLASYEDDISTIEHDLIQLEKDILWVERFR